MALAKKVAAPSCKFWQGRKGYFKTKDLLQGIRHLEKHGIASAQRAPKDDLGGRMQSLSTLVAMAIRLAKRITKTTNLRTGVTPV